LDDNAGARILEDAPWRRSPRRLAAMLLGLEIAADGDCEVAARSGTVFGGG
jgi:hypothetical protein